MEPLGPVDNRECICSWLPSGVKYVAAVELSRSGGEEYQYCVSSRAYSILWEAVGSGLLVDQRLIILYRLWVMSAISGLMYGTQYFQEKDLPLYSRGLEIMIGVSAAGASRCSDLDL